MNIAILQQEIDIILVSLKTKEEKLQAICDFLENEIPYYDWVGFYFKNGDKRLNWEHVLSTTITKIHLQIVKLP